MAETTWNAAEHKLRVTPEQFRDMQSILADATLSNADRNTALLRAGGMDDDLAFLALVYSGCTGEPVTICVRPSPTNSTRPVGEVETAEQ